MKSIRLIAITIALLISVVPAFIITHFLCEGFTGILEQTAGTTTQTIALTAGHEIQDEINNKIEVLDIYFKNNKELKQVLKESNKEFENYTNITQRLLELDALWRDKESQESKDFKNEIIQNNQSKELIALMDEIERLQGLSVFPEIFVTNKYGANVAQTGETSDYYQADEGWWHKGKDLGYYLDEAEYDESADTFARPIILKIEDNGEFLGVIKFVLNLELIENILLHVSEENDELKVVLLNEKGEAYLATHENISVVKQAMMEKNGYQIAEDGSIQSYAQINEKGQYISYLDVILVVNTLEKETASFQNLIDQMVTFIIILSILTAIIAMLLASRFTNSLVKLTESAHKIGEGKLKTPIDQKILKSKTEIGKLANAFEQMRSKLNKKIEDIEQLNDQKSRLLTQLAHDLKTPLVPIIAVIPELMKEENEHERKEILKMLSNSSNRLNKLVKQTLTLLMLSSEKYKLAKRSADPKKLFEETIKKKAKNKNIKKDFNDVVSIHIDKQRIIEAIESLIDNAEKYSPKDSQIEYKLRQDADYIVFSVKDQGPGIPKDKQSKVFEEFYKADWSRHESSSGLGLALVKRIVELHNGTVFVESEEGKGSTFGFRLKVQ